MREPSNMANAEQLNLATFMAKLTRLDIQPLEAYALLDAARARIAEAFSGVGLTDKVDRAAISRLNLRVSVALQWIMYTGGRIFAADGLMQCHGLPRLGGMHGRVKRSGLQS